MQIATTTDESMLARLHRSDAQVSQQTIVTLRRQIATTTATHEASTHLPNYLLASMGKPFRGRTDTPISGYDSRPPNYSHVGSLPGSDWTTS